MIYRVSDRALDAANQVRRANAHEDGRSLLRRKLEQAIAAEIAAGRLTVTEEGKT